MLRLKNLASAAAVVKKDVSLDAAEACSLAVTTVASLNLSDVIDPVA